MPGTKNEAIFRIEHFHIGQPVVYATLYLHTFVIIAIFSILVHYVYTNNQYVLIFSIFFTGLTIVISNEK